ncbi:MAG: insulinase family protein, partial [Planctomycetes bacterium]|nr:insulinase family protein [Planctomycetota bacterium]
MRKLLSLKAMITLFLLLSVSTGLSSAEDAMQPLAVIRQVEHPGGVLEVKFENGLTLLCKENFAAPVVATRVFVRIGSIYEGEMLGSGVSHYFEHIISGGTTSTRSEAESRALLQRIGNNSNAYTSRDATVYFITTEAQHFPTAANLLGDYMANCLVDETEFNRERGVIIQEIRKLEDDPNRCIYQLLGETMFPLHPAGQPVIGHLELFKQVTRGQVEEFYHRFYVANNITVVVAGAVKAEGAIKEIAISFANLKRGMVHHPAMPPVPRQTSSKWAEESSAKINKLYLSVGHHTVTLDHPDLFALDVAADILGAGRTSRLYRSLREQGLVQGVYAYSHTPAYNAGVFGIGATLEEENLPAVLSTLVEEINRLKLESVSREELQRVVKKKITDELFG